jgi:signal transduction histidine kinase
VFRLLQAQSLRSERHPGDPCSGEPCSDERGLAPPLPGDAPGDRRLDVSPMLTAVRLSVVALALIALPLTTPHPQAGAAGVAWKVSIGVAAAACVTWLLLAVVPDGLPAPRREQVFTAALVVLGLSGGILAGLSPFNSAIAIGCVVTSTAGVRMRPELSLAVTAETVAAFLLAGLASGASTGTLLGYPLAFAGMWAFGLTRYSSLRRAELAERTLEQTRRARDAETQAAALAERARIAREIHDVLAHSLGAVSVNLQAAEGLLSTLPDSPELAKALECVERAGAFTRDGLAEARRAVRALRDTAAATPPEPIAGQLARLVTEFGETGDAPAEFRVLGAERAVGAEPGLAVYRTAQEALTNARKHAPGQPVTITLEFMPESVELRAVNPLPAPRPDPAPLAASGGGHGLTGLRERAALAGGALTTGPAGGQWEVCLQIPA